MWLLFFLGIIFSYWCLVENEGMIHWLTINNNPSNPQQPIHSLRLAPVSTILNSKVNIQKSMGFFSFYSWVNQLYF